jgi:aminoethylphosphonate catabolism LysR family transcriptional regulator
MAINLTQLRAFHAVARHQGFTAAARALHISQPAVTAQVKALEADHGVEVFVRKPRAVELTPIGKALYAVAEQLFAREADAARLLGDATALRSGGLRIGADNPYQLMPILRALRTRLPEIELSVSFGNNREVTEQLVSYAIDVALVARPPARPELGAIELGQDPVVLVVGAKHPWAKRRKLPLAALDGEPMIRREAGSRTQDEFDRACARAHVVPLFPIEMSSREALREAIACGVGIGVISRAELGVDPRLRAVALSSVNISLHEVVAFVATRREAPLIRAFLDVAKDVARVRPNGAIG